MNHRLWHGDSGDFGSGGGERRCSLVGLSLTLCDLTLSLGEQCQN